MLCVRPRRRGAGGSPYTYNFVRLVGSYVVCIFIGSQMCSCALYGAVREKETKQMVTVPGVLQSFAAVPSAQVTDKMVGIKPNYNESLTSLLFKWAFFILCQSHF